MVLMEQSFYFEVISNQNSYSPITVADLFEAFS